MSSGWCAAPAWSMVLASVAITAFAFGVMDGEAESLRRVPPSLIEAARQSGSVRVIVQLVQPAGVSVAAAQDAVLAELAGTGYRVLQRYANSPALALEAGEDALLVLDRSPNVRSVAADFEMQHRAPGTRP